MGGIPFRKSAGVFHSSWTGAPKTQRFQKENIVKKEGGINNSFSVNFRTRALGKFASSDVRHQVRSIKGELL